MGLPVSYTGFFSAEEKREMSNGRRSQSMADWKEERRAEKEREREQQRMFRVQTEADESYGPSTSVIREWAETARLASAGEEAIESLFREEQRPGIFPDTPETNLQNRTIVNAETALPQPPLPLLPLVAPGAEIIRSPIQMPQPGSVNPGRGNQGQDRTGRSDKKVDQPAVEIFMNVEQQELLAWLFILERCEALKRERRNHKADIFNKWATFVISTLGIIGGILAIRAGTSSITEKK